MKNARWYWTLLGLVAVLAVVPVSCVKNNGGGGGTIPTTSPSSSPTGSPGPCGTENPTTAANLVIVDMGLQILPTTAPTYGPINGYAPDDNGAALTQATIINEWIPPIASATSEPVTSQDILQFVNTDASANHSAVSFPSAPPFPPSTYTFPSPAASPSTNTVIGNGFWSTGIVSVSNPSTGVPCYSQTFTLKPGVYYFGDYNYYSSALMRDVLVVVSPGAVATHARSRGRDIIRPLRN